VNASKENARRALELLEASRPPHVAEGPALAWVRQFLEVAARKLPSDASFARAAARRAPAKKAADK
jgi:hypothetical protein